MNWFQEKKSWSYQKVIVEFDSKFYKSLKKSNLTNELKSKVNNLILDFEKA